MDEYFPIYLTCLDAVLSVGSLIFFLTDVVLDVLAVIKLYEEQKFFSMGLLILLLLGSSALIQIFSWLWYSDPNRNVETKAESFVRRHGLLNLVHICQLGVFLRFAGVMENTIRSYNQRDRFQKGVTVFLNHELSMLRLFEAFFENAPQLVLMIALTVKMQKIQFFTVAKIVGSLSSLSLSVLSYHRYMRAFLVDKSKMRWPSSVMYFLWNLFLIGPRVMGVSLFASGLPCYVAAHFLSLWTLLVFWAWWQKTDFMDSRAGEWLYRATVGLIWYFSWFNVASGSTKLNGMIYHVVIGVDTMLLLGLWWWWRTVESARLNPLPMNPFLLVAVLVIIYITGILLKLLYYWKFHPNKPDLQIGAAEKDENSETEPQPPQRTAACIGMEHTDPCKPPAPPHKPATGRNLTGIQKRMKMMAENFYN
ncbi:XK-related protein 8 [Bagarius yarrelli]|uniref:XK-related protein n=1 Tax=Bagarius yarrelli TaxID=175774 RepID=A0A556TP56_BAGYA|nr:XK-related protein 8 [Bagarius yarrelli]